MAARRCRRRAQAAAGQRAADRSAARLMQDAAETAAPRSRSTHRPAIAPERTAERRRSGLDCARPACIDAQPWRMRIPFIKMHGLGNDFVVLDARADALPAMTSRSWRAALADRQTGIGCDQLIVLEPRQPAPISGCGSSTPTAARWRPAAMPAARSALLHGEAATIETWRRADCIGAGWAAASRSTWARRGLTGTQSRSPMRWIR